MYVIPQGTTGKIIKQSSFDEITITDWVTRRELKYERILINPFIYHNNRAINLPDEFTKLAERGCGIFGGSLGDDKHAQYLIAVPYPNIIINTLNEVSGD